MSRLLEALDCSWGPDTAYRGEIRPGNNSFGQCYPTSRVVQWFYPEFEVVRGDVWTGHTVERHFWNVRAEGDETIDLTWSQFPDGSIIRSREILSRYDASDSASTLERCEVLLRRVLAQLAS